MNNDCRFVKIAILLPLLLISISFAGCGSPPRGDHQGRVDPYATTPEDRGDSRANFQALLEHSDVAAQSLAQKIVHIPDIKNAPSKVVVELGTLNNETRTPTSDFRLLQNRLRGKLLQSDVLLKVAVVNEEPEKMSKDQERYGAKAGEPDRLDMGQGGAARTDRYDPNITYLLTGIFHEANRGGDKRYYYFEFKLVNLGSRKIVFSEMMDLAQIRE
ncbi:MAG: hypothetical protein ACKVS6_10840 [Planctomycetota bacterium]